MGAICAWQLRPAGKLAATSSGKKRTVRFKIGVKVTSEGGHFGWDRNAPHIEAPIRAPFNKVETQEDLPPS